MTDQPKALRVAAELDALALKACGPGHWPLERVAARLLREQHEEIQELREANEALRRDAERYHYLRNRDPKQVLRRSGKSAGVWIDWEDDLSGLQLLTGDDADAAIDAAMGGQAMSEKSEALMKWAKDAGSSPEDLVRFATLIIADRDAEIERLREALAKIVAMGAAMRDEAAEVKVAREALQEVPR